MKHVCLLTLAIAGRIAAADEPPPSQPAVQPYVPTTAQTFGDPNAPSAFAQAPAPDPNTPKTPKAGDWDAGGQLKFPSGPDGDGKYATYNWIDVDLKGTYYLAPTVTANLLGPVAVHHPDQLMDGTEPKMFGGFRANLEATLPKLPAMPFLAPDSLQLGLGLTFGYMHDGAMLLSDKDYPLFVGNFHPGFKGDLIMKLKLSSLVDFALVPAWVYQGGEPQAHAAIQVPMSLIVKLADLVQVAADTGVFTGDQYHLSGDAGGRIYAGGSLTVKIWKLQAHAGLGVASLLTGGLYPSIGDSVYVDLNVTYVR